MTPAERRAAGDRYHKAQQDLLSRTLKGATVQAILDLTTADSEPVEVGPNETPEEVASRLGLTNPNHYAIIDAPPQCVCCVGLDRRSSECSCDEYCGALRCTGVRW